MDEMEIDIFPHLREDQLRELTFGVYQLWLSTSYIQEHLEGNCEIRVDVDELSLLCVKMQSRHTLRKKYL